MISAKSYKLQVCVHIYFWTIEYCTYAILKWQWYCWFVPSSNVHARLTLDDAIYYYNAARAGPENLSGWHWIHNFVVHEWKLDLIMHSTYHGNDQNMNKNESLKRMRPTRSMLEHNPIRRNVTQCFNKFHKCSIDTLRGLGPSSCERVMRSLNCMIHTYSQTSDQGQPRRYTDLY